MKLNKYLPKIEWPGVALFAAACAAVVTLLAVRQDLGVADIASAVGIALAAFLRRRRPEEE